MQKIYVLLRNDKQTGPYSLEEIVQFDLKPYDLIWIEGKSAGWYYPQEIGALRPYLRFLPQIAKPMVVPGVAPEKKAVTGMPFVPKKEEAPVAAAIEPAAKTIKEEHKLSGPSKNLEQAVYAQFSTPLIQEEPLVMGTTAANQSTKKSPNAVAVGIVAVLIVGSVFAASWFMNRHPDEEETATANMAAPPAQTEVPAVGIAKNDRPKNATVSPVIKQQTQANNRTLRQTTVVAEDAAAKLPTRSKQGQTAAVGSGTQTADEEAATTSAPKEEAATNKETPTTPAAPQEKKKTLRDKILGIFHKKPDEKEPEKAKPAATENGERQSTHRESGANLAQLVNIRFTVPNDWMMGIKGAKATLVNHSSETVSKATVEILYYNDDNELLQKKTVTFGKVDSKDSQTVPIPDHPSATRVDYNIVSVTAKPAA